MAERSSFHSSLFHKEIFYKQYKCVYCMHVRVHKHVCVGKSEDRFQDLVLSGTMWDLGIVVRLSALAASSVTS